MYSFRKIKFGGFAQTTVRLFGNWIYKDNASTYCHNVIEKQLKALKGGSVDLKLNDEYGIGLLKINNPPKKNAFTGKMMHDLRKAVEQLMHWKDGKAVILFGANHSFCSGADLATVKEFLTREEDGENMCMYMQDTLTELHRLPFITVAFVEGKAIGGGAELTTACDFRVLTEDAEIRFVHKTMGLIPGWGGVTRLTRLLGPQNTLKLLTSAQKLNAHQAAQLGIADHVIALSQKDIFHNIQVQSSDEDGVETKSCFFDCNVQKVNNWLQSTFDLNNTDASVLKAIKSSVVACSEAITLDASLRFEKDFFCSVWGAEANLNALASSRHSK